MFQLMISPGPTALRTFCSALLGFAEGSSDLGLSVSIVAHAGCAIPALFEFGSETLQARLVPALLSGEHLAGIANAEKHSGTDVLGLKSSARFNSNGYTLRLRKYSITNVGDADVVLDSARMDDKIDVFAVLRDQINQREIKDLSGLRTSSTGHLEIRREQFVQGAGRTGRARNACRGYL